MQKNIAIIVFLILLGCRSGPHHREVMINKTVKVFSEDYHEHAENYTFKWNPPIGPNNKKVIFDLRNDMLIFTPKTIGNYEVNLVIEDISEEVVAKEIFYYKAIIATIEAASVKPEIEISSAAPPLITKEKPEKPPLKRTQTRHANDKKTKKPSKRKQQLAKSKIMHAEYAIQISAWPSLEEARKHQLELMEEGFDAYTQRYYLQKKDEVWYRVRVGNYFNKQKALKVKKQIESFTGITTWLDIVSTK